MSYDSYFVPVIWCINDGVFDDSFVKCNNVFLLLLFFFMQREIQVPTLLFRCRTVPVRILTVIREDGPHPETNSYTYRHVPLQ